MTAAEADRPARHPIQRLYDALIDPARNERVMALLLGGYFAVWSLYGAIAKSSQDINFDMGEMFAWSGEVGLGTPKHPPLGAWLVGAWFGIFPRRDWAYYMFAMLLATAALWIAWRVSARYLTPQKRAVGVMLLMLVPFYNFHALKFNANSVLTPFWAVTTWWFLRSFETRRAGWSILAGVGAAAAMLGKYWSFFLLAGLGIAALTDPRRTAYFRSPAPWLTIGAGAIALAPNLVWVVRHDYAPFRYAVQQHPATVAAAALSAAGFLGGIAGYIAVPLIFWVLAARPGATAIADTLWPADPNRRIAAIALLAPLILAVLAALVLQVAIVSLWAMCAMTLLPVLLLSSPLVSFSRAAAVRLLTLAIVFPLLMLGLSPLIAIVIHHNGVSHYATHDRLIAHAVERAWRGRTAAPLRIVGSDTSVVNSMVFYVAGRPMTLDITTPAQTPWVTDDGIKRDGAALVCPQPEAQCAQAMNGYASRYHAAAAETVTLSSRYFGMSDTPVRYDIVIIPPQ